MAERSYVCPSPVHSTGSTKTVCVSGHSIHSGARDSADTVLSSVLSRRSICMLLCADTVPLGAAAAARTGCCGAPWAATSVRLPAVPSDASADVVAAAAALLRARFRAALLGAAAGAPPSSSACR
jgi:hypothetical protein